MQFDCEIDGFGDEAGCNKGKGIRRAFIADGTLIDWDLMFADALKFDPVNEILLGYTYKAGGEHHEIKFERTTSTYNAERTRENGYYEVLMNIVLEGNNAERSKKIKRLVGCCDLALHLYLANGTQRVLGIDFDGEGFTKPVLKFEIARHRNDGGSFGGDDSRDELDFNGQTEFEPMYASVPVADLIASIGATEVFGPNEGGSTAYGPTAGGDVAYGPTSGVVLPAEVEAAKTKKVTTKKGGNASK